jgi:tetratricopeptide (TPR) repeat protein
VLDVITQHGTPDQQARCLFALGLFAFDRSDHSTASARYEQAALPLFRQVGSVLGEASCIQGLGDIALDRSDHDAARNRYERALALYQAIEDPFSIGWAQVRLARLDPAGDERDRHWAAAREAWGGIGREDLIASVAPEFE